MSTPCAWCRVGAPVGHRLDVDLCGLVVRMHGVSLGKPICASCIDAWADDAEMLRERWASFAFPGLHRLNEHAETDDWVRRMAAEACRNAKPVDHRQWAMFRPLEGHDVARQGFSTHGSAGIKQRRKA